MRMLLMVLLVLLILVQLRFWQEVREFNNLQQLLNEQLAENEQLQQRNAALAAEVEDLRSGLAAVEERARAELGLIADDEEFYLIVAPESVD